MPNESFDKAKATEFAEFDKMGEDRVRLLAKRISGPRKDFADEWLAKINQEARLRNDASQAESLTTAISAKDAAWAAADAASRAANEASRAADEASRANALAKNANTIATMAAIIAIICTAVTLVVSFVGGAR